MTINGWLQIALYCVLLLLITRPIGGYMTRVFNGERTLLSPVLRPLERAIYRLCGVDETQEQYWVGYAIAMLAFSLAGFVVMYGIAAIAERAAVQSGGSGRGVARSRVQHLGQLHHQYQLAVVRPRDDDELPDPDGRVDGA